LESEPVPADFFEAVRSAAAGPGGLAVAEPGPALTAVLAGDTPASRARPDRALAVDLAGDPGGWLARVLLGLDAPRLAILVPNNHSDLVSEAAQRGLRDLVAAKYRLRLRRSTPGPRHAIVEAERVDTADLDPAHRVVRGVVGHALGKLANTWREALVGAAAAEGTTLTKNEARARIRATGTTPELLEQPLLSLPRHEIAELLAAIADSSLPVPDRGVGDVS
jgi:hypothetical protein